MGMDKLWESKQKLDQINQFTVIPAESTLSSVKFEDRHKRITIYLERDVYVQLQIMRSRGYSQTRVINNALRLFWEEFGEDAI
ncbi:hypothetical protein SPACI_050780 [Sporomusa acidovorans DSM 3132]|uniref:CopG family transcriptional regulator n=2 Tax=Sporomusa TaxID=2375 RepID=A0ABZ3JAP8_SPOA4|nr:hypothetical protein SPACI_10220 [Sporomusa acidovorans DSM 3132]SDE94215.1 hypothetical protein SAMN04488499_102731 [Sporomusa acidovorans]